MNSIGEIVKKYSWLIVCCLLLIQQGIAGSALEDGFINPPPSSRAWCFWWWTWNSMAQISKESVTEDLEAMREQGLAGVTLFTIGYGKPASKTYLSEEWLDLLRHTVSECRRLEIGFSIHASDGWANTGGPWIAPENAMKKVVGSTVEAQGAVRLSDLPMPENIVAEFYRDISILAFQTRPIRVGETLDLNELLKGNALVELPPGTWTVVRVGYTLTGKQNHPASRAGTGWECDKLSKDGVEAHFLGIRPIVEILKESQALGGDVLLFVDSYEAGFQNWTESLPDEFMRRCGYRIEPWLPVLAGQVVENAEQSKAFLADFNRVLETMRKENWMGHLRTLCSNEGIRLQAQSDSEQADIPMGEFWAVSSADRKYLPEGAEIHYEDDPLRIFWPPTVRKAVAESRLNGSGIVAAETLTSRSPCWERTPYQMKPAIDWAFCRGINRITHHLYVHQIDTQHKPGWINHGTVVNRNVTWWEYSSAWFDYLARSQFLLQQGSAVEDVCVIDGRWPQTAVGSDIPTGFSGQVMPVKLLDRIEADSGMWILPDGTRCPLLVVAEGASISPERLARLNRLLDSGGALLLKSWPACPTGRQVDADLFTQVLLDIQTKSVLTGMSIEDAFSRISLKKDLLATASDQIDFIHRRTVDGSDIYFLVNKTGESVTTECSLRTSGAVVERWDSRDGRIESVVTESREGRTVMNLNLSPYESCFIVVRPVRSENISGIYLPASSAVLQTVSGPWNVHFYDAFGQPVAEKVWSEPRFWHEEDELKYFSGKAEYETRFEFAANAKGEIWLELGDVADMAEVEVNGKSAGIIWAQPYRVNVSGMLKPGMNSLKISVINSWANRVIGDAGLPVVEQTTQILGSKVYPIYEKLSIEPAGIRGPIHLVRPMSVSLSSGLQTGTVAYENGRLPYRFYVPEEAAGSKRLPLVLCLHGAGGRGRDNKGGGSHAMAVLSRPDVQRSHPAFLLMPQCPESSQWVNTPWAEGSYCLDNIPASAEMTAVYQLLQDVIQRYPIDTQRIYITGQSMGGFGTWDMIMRWPELFAAAVPVCGGGDPSLAGSIKDIPILAFHGAKDPVVPADATRAMVKALQEIGGNVTYVEYPEEEHGAWIPAWRDPATVEWLFKQKKGEGDQMKRTEKSMVKNVGRVVAAGVLASNIVCAAAVQDF